MPAAVREPAGEDGVDGHAIVLHRLAQADPAAWTARHPLAQGRPSS
ncbi:hypothetical protein ACFW9L_07700 [Streptomyces sp. NPDC059517]